MRKRRIALIPLAIVVLLAGCGGNTEQVKPGEVGAGGGMAMPTIPAFEPPQTWTIPETIDIAYVQRVMNELERVNLELVVEAYTTHRFSEVVEQKLNDIYDEPYLSVMVHGVSDDSAKVHPNLKKDPMPAAIKVKSLRTVRSDCVSAIVDLDYGPLQESPFPPAEFSVTLRRAEKPLNWNRSQWKSSNWDGTSGDSSKVDRCAEG